MIIYDPILGAIEEKDTDKVKQEIIAAENINGQDVVLAAKPSKKPLSKSGFLLMLNGLVQEEGAGKDYMLNLTTREITWLAGTGTAVNLELTDIILIFYKHK